MTNASSLIKKIHEETTLKSEWEDPEYLSQLLLRLASYYSTLAVLVADAKRTEDIAESSYVVVKEQTKIDFIKGGDSVALAESQAVLSAAESKEELISRRYNAKLMTLSLHSLDRNMDAIRSRLSFIKSEKERGL